jgi:hypothetical protein
MNEYLMVMSEVEKARLSRQGWKGDQQEGPPSAGHPSSGRLRVRIQRVLRYLSKEESGQTNDQEEKRT